MARPRVLIIDDEEGVRTSLGLILEDEGYEVATSADAATARQQVARASFDVVLCDVRMPGESGLDLLPDLAALLPDATLLMMSAHGDVEQALEAVRRGAYDYLAKPFKTEELLLAIRKAEERERLRRENRRLRSELDSRDAPSLVAASRQMHAVIELIERAAEYKTTVLVTGESGAGKEVVARHVHGRSARCDQPFLAVNCGAIPEALIESELFGHARGAFTGAEQEKRGLFREADGGTVFLDEIGELPQALQVKLLRVLQEEEVQPVGEAKPAAVDVRILAATSRNLEAEVAAGRFRPDLFYRLNVVRIHVPPLRERVEDIPVLADHLLRRISRRIGKPVAPLATEALDELSARAWPGNVRELENAIERAIILCPGREIGAELLGTAEPHTPQRSEAAEDLSVKRRVRTLEERLIRLALQRTAGNRSQAARVLELSPRALQYKIKEYAIDPLNPLSAQADSSE